MVPPLSGNEFNGHISPISRSWSRVTVPPLSGNEFNGHGDQLAAVRSPEFGVPPLSGNEFNGHLVNAAGFGTLIASRRSPGMSSTGEFARN